MVTNIALRSGNMRAIQLAEFVNDNGSRVPVRRRQFTIKLLHYYVYKTSISSALKKDA